MIKWFHHLLNPHCQDCIDERRENKTCDSCNTLRDELAAARYNNKQLLEAILESTRPPVPVIVQESSEKKVLNHSQTWRTRKNLLEAEDREKARILREHSTMKVESSKSTEELEKELLGDVENG